MQKYSNLPQEDRYNQEIHSREGTMVGWILLGIKKTCLKKTIIQSII